MKVFSSVTAGNRLYYVSIHRGTEYTLSQSPVTGLWEVMTSRLSLGRIAGSVKHFDSLNDVCSKCKAFAGLDELLNSSIAA